MRELPNWQEYVFRMDGADTIQGMRQSLSPEFRELMREMNASLRKDNTDVETQEERAAAQESPGPS